MPLQPHRPTSFCPLSPEAVLLTEDKVWTGKIPPTLFPPQAKRGSERSDAGLSRRLRSIRQNLVTRSSHNFSYIYINQQPGPLFTREPGCLVNRKTSPK
jgi:hypothetical protein